MGRIRRVSSADAFENYTLLSTSAYNASDPAATTVAWPADAADMDRAFSVAYDAGAEVASEGCLITFARYPYRFTGVKVKIRPTYDVSLGEDPYIEMWTHDSSLDTWTRRRRVQLRNPYVGVESGTLRIVLLTLSRSLQDVDKVWITMAPSGTETMRFNMIHLFGFCEWQIVTPSCPEPPCDLPAPECLDDPNACLIPPIDCATFPELCTVWPDLPALDLCDATSVAEYRAALAAYPAPALEQFDTFYWTLIQSGILDALCEEVPDDPPLICDDPPPALDLCDPDSIQTFRLWLACSADALAAFDELITQLEATGFFDLCDPPADQDPLTDELVDEEPVLGATPSFDYLLFYNNRDQTNFTNNVAAEESAEIKALLTNDRPAQQIVYGLPVSGDDGARQTTRLDAATLTVSGAGYLTYVGVRALWAPCERLPSGQYRDGMAGAGVAAGYEPFGSALNHVPFFPWGPAIIETGPTAFGWVFDPNVDISGQNRFGTPVDPDPAFPGYYIFQRKFNVWVPDPDPPYFVLTGETTLPPSNALALEPYGLSGLANGGFTGLDSYCLGPPAVYSQIAYFSLYISIVVFDSLGNVLSLPNGTATVTIGLSKTESYDLVTPSGLPEKTNYLAPC